MKYAVFTGAAGGLGSACALEMAKQGWSVFALDINEQALAKIGENENIIPIKVDITDRDSIAAAKAEIEKTTDKLDAIINFAGIHTIASMVEGNADKIIERMLKINVQGMVNINKAFFPLVKKAGGRVINCSSECGWMKPQPFNGPYSMTKYAVDAYTESLRRELMFLGIKVVKIQPGSFKTEMHNAATEGFNRLYENTEYFKDVLARMKPLMDFELKLANDPKHMVKAILAAVNSEKPKINYRVKNSKLLGSLEYIPDPLLDKLYKLILSY
ncbi:MAG: SDR family NAD(P)-dependent oxidoreductase [Clostridiales bacterium]|nr:SDR family NAD(P)-dependent oxidoreductase [Clostridiales bacterium]